MEEKTLRILEWDKLLGLLSGYASSDPGRALCLRLMPSSNFRRVNGWQQNTEDAILRLRHKGAAPSFGGLRDLKDITWQLSAGAALSPGELLLIADLMETADRVRRYGMSDEEEISDSITELFSMLMPLTQSVRAIRKAITPDEEIADDASPALLSVRRNIRQAESDIRNRMNSLVNSNRDLLTEPVVALRGSRYCLPVKAEYKSKIQGIVHDSSSTGLTLFIEPLAAVELGNKLRELRMREKDEIEKVLRELSAELMPHAEEINADVKIMSSLDMIFAKAVYAEESCAVRPAFSRDRSIDFRSARHPLIAPETVVPVDLRLGGDFDILVVTGPNTGGKTVSLKTCGLLTLMAQAGLHIPAAAGSVAGIYKNVYADIGDEQSIEQNLSTFSSHMTNIIHILKQADARSLCLFDELGSGTDPAEGAALGTAILEELKKKKVHAVATTHYAQIKVYALETEGVENACCEFDIETLRPTYRLLIGIPGSSNAFRIAGRLGLSDDIIREARLRLDPQSGSLEKVIADLSRQRTAAEKALREAEQKRDDAEKLRERLREREERLTKNREKIAAGAEADARRILEKAKEEADRALRNIDRLAITGDRAGAEKEREKLRKALNEVSAGPALSAKGPSRPVSPSKLKTGDLVRVMPFGGAVGEVLKLPDKDGFIQVRIGSMQSRVSVKDVEMADDPGGDKGTRHRSSERKAPAKRAPGSEDRELAMKALSISPELNLIGMTTDEAEPLLEKYLDDAYLSHLEQVRIVHGRGTWALRDMVRGRLGKTAYVASFRQGEFGEGDSGVTVVSFK